MTLMILECFEKHNYVIKEHADKITVLTKYVIHQLIKGCGSVCKPERHYHELVQPKSRTKRSLVNVIWVYPDLMIFALQVYPTEVGRTLKLVKDIFNSWYQKFAPFADS